MRLVHSATITMRVNTETFHDLLLCSLLLPPGPGPPSHNMSCIAGSKSRGTGSQTGILAKIGFLDFVTTSRAKIKMNSL